MNKTIYRTATGVAVLLVMAQALAHDPSEHKNDSAQPNCEAMKTMDDSGVDKNDPVMMSMKRGMVVPRRV